MLCYVTKFHEACLRKKWYTNKRIKNALEISTFQTIFHVLTIPAYVFKIPIIYEIFDPMACLEINLARR